MQPELCDGGRCGRPHISNGERVPAGKDGHKTGVLLGMLWKDRVYVDKVLPFGLRSAPLLFTVVADMLQWIMTLH